MNDDKTSTLMPETPCCAALVPWRGGGGVVVCRGMGRGDDM